ncbi:hypothetical protein Cni_G14105 [Canna indica]|uniref:Protein AATF n=1 Tax=Canna indica TaxID=4628 RepID=A0AAQ3KB81_9LILI|nr:hypothetical protein Cni_G14105 [Canna indica]
MGAARKRCKHESEHSTEEDSNFESGMKFASERMQQDFVDEEDSASDGESLSEGEMEEDDSAADGESLSEGEMEEEEEEGEGEEEDEEEEEGGEGEGEEEDEEEDEHEENENESEGSDAEQNGREMDELEKQYQNLRSEHQDLLKNLKRQNNEDAAKGQAIKNQKVLWDKILELRILLQKTYSSSNKLPQEPLRSSFCNSTGDLDPAYSDLISSSKKTLSSILDLQEALLEKNPSILQDLTENSKVSCDSADFFNKLKEDNDEEWPQISNMHSRIAPFRNSSIDKWYRKIQVTSGAAAFRGKLQAFNQNISEQVAGFMRDPSRMIKRMQMRRSSVRIFGNIPQMYETETVKEEDGNIDGDPELLEDSEFYSQLLKEFLEANVTADSAYYALRKLQPKKRKLVDRRASKSRKIRYHVHEKIVNFMAPEPMALPSMAPKLFDNLFGISNQKSTSAM